MIEAARELILSRQALAGFSIDAVAKQAGVARMTVYNQFGGKRGLIEALFDDIGSRGNIFQVIEISREDPLDELDTFIDAFGFFWHSERLILKRLHAMNALDEEMGKADRERQSRRRRGLQKIVGRLQEEKKFQSEFSFEQAIEILQTLTSFETFDSLAGENRTPVDVVPIVQKIARSVLSDI